MVGAFWGTFEAGDSVHIHNLTRHGALLESHQPLAVESIQAICLTLDGEPAIADARVRHVRSVTSAAHNRYLVGVEFLTTSVTFHEAIDRLVAYRASHTELA